MLKQIKQFIKKHQDMSHAVEYLSTHMKYHLMSIQSISKNDNKFAVFGREQLNFLVKSRISNLNNNEISKIIDLALQKVITTTKIKPIINRNIIYIAL
ncbi:MAG: hypothetical protein ACK5Z5_04670 [Neisseriaceae bacterium]|jgi:hypothetical protein